MIKTGDHTGWVAGAFTFINLVNAQATDHVPEAFSLLSFCGC